MFISVDLPAPLGPMMAVSSPERHDPFTAFKIVLKPRERPSGTEYEMSVNEMPTGGRFGRCVRVTCSQNAPNQTNQMILEFHQTEVALLMNSPDSFSAHWDCCCAPSAPVPGRTNWARCRHCKRYSANCCEKYEIIQSAFIDYDYQSCRRCRGRFCTRVNNTRKIDARPSRECNATIYFMRYVGVCLLHCTPTQALECDQHV